MLDGEVVMYEALLGNNTRKPLDVSVIFVDCRYLARGFK